MECSHFICHNRFCESEQTLLNVLRAPPLNASHAAQRSSRSRGSGNVLISFDLITPLVLRCAPASLRCCIDSFSLVRPSGSENVNTIRVVVHVATGCSKALLFLIIFTTFIFVSIRVCCCFCCSELLSFVVGNYSSKVRAEGAGGKSRGRRRRVEGGQQI